MIGQTVAHYQILEKIGEGGMGVVYRARDTRLERDVALKFLSVDFTGSEELKQRFIQEAKSASVLDHPNICTIHAIEETSDGRLFIAMGYYPGKTVKAKLKEGPLDWQEIVDLAVQIASGLQAAHERGLVHMDIKPANLMVTPDGTVKILDFGLSRFTSEIDRTRPQGPLMGTVAYMPPEQVQGEETGPGSDLWSLGVVLYELATGKRPFHGKNDMAVLYSIVHRDVEPPIRTRTDLPVALDKIIRRALVRDRRYRYRDVEALLADFEPLQQNSHAVTDTVPGISPQDWQRQKVLQRFTVMIAVLAVVFSAVFFASTINDGGEDPPEPATQVLIVGFQNLAPVPDSDWLGDVMEELLLFAVPHRQDLRWIHSSDYAGPGEEFVSNPGLSLATRAGIQRELDADWTVGGGYLVADGEVPGQLRVELLAQDLRTGEVLERMTLDDRRTSELPEVMAGWAETLSPIIGFPLPSRPPVEAAVADGDSAAAGLLAEARAQLRLLEAKEAIEILGKAIELEPVNPEFHLTLAEALGQLRHDQAAVKMAAKARGFALNLPLREQVRYHAWDLELRGNRKPAAVLFRWLWLHRSAADPAQEDETFDRGLHLALLSARANLGEVVLEILEPLRPRLDGDPRPHLITAEAARRHSRPAQREAAGRAARLAERIGAPLVLARALSMQGEAYLEEGELDRATEQLHAVMEIYVEKGYKWGEGNCLILLGIVQWKQQDRVTARESWEKAERLLSEIGSRDRMRAVHNLALLYAERGDLGPAIEKIYRQAADDFKKTGQTEAMVQTLVNIAGLQRTTGDFEAAEQTHTEVDRALEGLSLSTVALARQSRAELLIDQGRLSEARRSLQEARDAQEEMGENPDSAVNSRLLALVFDYQGDLEETVRLQKEALEGFTTQGEDELSAEVRRHMGETLTDQGRLDQAQAVLKEALKTQDTHSNPLSAAATRLALAELALARGKPGDAEELARNVLVNVNSRALPLLSRTHVILARCGLALNRRDGAQEEIDKARGLLEKIDSPIYSVPLEITEARLLAARGEESQALEQLELLITKTHNEILVEMELEIRLAHGEIQLSTGRLGQARSRLAVVAETARIKGYNLISQKAREAKDR